MRMKMFTAGSLEEARKSVIAELGKDAVILSEKKTAGGFQVRAAVNKSYTGQLIQSLNDRLGQNQAINDLYNGPTMQRLKDTLAWHGMTDRSIRSVTRVASNKLKTDLAQNFETLLNNSLGEFCQFTDIAPEPAQNLILVGPPGHGRTATLAKLAKRAKDNGGKIIPVAADLDATAGADQLRAYLEADHGLVKSTNTPKGLFALLKELDNSGQRYVIDLPAIVPFDAEDMARLSDLLAVTNARPVLVVSAEGYPEDQMDIAKKFADVGIKDALVTKIDMTQRRGGIIAALAMNKMALTFISSTPFIGSGLVDASSEVIASIFVEEFQDQIGLKGAA